MHHRCPLCTHHPSLRRPHHSCRRPSLSPPPFTRRLPSAQRAHDRRRTVSPASAPAPPLARNGGGRRRANQEVAWRGLPPPLHSTPRITRAAHPRPTPCAHARTPAPCHLRPGHAIPAPRFTPASPTAVSRKWGARVECRARAREGTRNEGGTTQAEPRWDGRGAPRRGSEKGFGGVGESDGAPPRTRREGG